jgi:hypothetical protein
VEGCAHHGTGWSFGVGLFVQSRAGALKRGPVWIDLVAYCPDA